MLRRKNLLVGIAVVAGIPIVALAWWLASPIFIDKAVDEEFPFAANAVVPIDMTMHDVEKIMAESASVDTPVDEAMPEFMVTNSEGAKAESTDTMAMDKSDNGVMTDKAITGKSSEVMVMDKVDDKAMTDKPADVIMIDKTDQAMTDKTSDAMAMDKMDEADDEMPEVIVMDKPHDDVMSEDKPLAVDAAMKSESQDATTAPATDAMTTDRMEDAAAEDSSTDAMMTQSSAVKLKEGSFRDADRSHRGSGTATIYRGPDGAHLLRLEDFNVTNGPDLRVILSPHENPTRREQVTSSEYIELDKLKGNKGNQNYAIPDNVDISAFNSIVIYCKPFHVIFSVASLEDVN